jgi:hypothetical protein
MPARNAKLPDRKGNVEVGISRYFALYAAQLGWIVLGAYLLSNAYWPSTCRPADLVEIYSCSGHLPDNRGWIESALATWLWSTPILVALEILRRFNKPIERPIVRR